MSSQPSAPSTGPRPLDGLTLARGLAAVAIVLHHGCGHLMQGDWSAIWRESGVLGLPALVVRSLLWFPDAFNHQAVLFFVLLSGFCIHMSLARRWARGDMALLAVGAYYRKRAVRLFPMMLGAAAVTAAADWFSGSIVEAGATAGALPGTPQVQAVLAGDWQSVGQLFGSVLFAMPFWIKPYGSNWPLWVLGWLAWFYLLYPAYAWISRRWNGYVALGAAFGVMVLSLALRRYSDPALYPVLRTWWLWCLGAFCAEVFVGRHPLPLWRRLPMLVALPGLVLTVALNQFLRDAPALAGYLLWSPLLAFLTVKLADAHELRPARAKRALLALGEMSFSLYVTHMPLMVLLTVIWCRTVGSLPRQPWLLLIALFPLMVAAAVFHSAVEAPVERLRSGERGKRTPAAA